MFIYRLIKFTFLSSPPAGALNLMLQTLLLFGQQLFPSYLEALSFILWSDKTKIEPSNRPGPAFIPSFMAASLIRRHERTWTLANVLFKSASHRYMPIFKHIERCRATNDTGCDHMYRKKQEEPRRRLMVTRTCLCRTIIHQWSVAWLHNRASKILLLVADETFWSGMCCTTILNAQLP